MVDVVFANGENPITPSISIIHDDESFRVEWVAFNVGAQDLPSFVDRLLVERIPEGCPGSDDIEHEAVFDSDVDGDPADFTEPDLLAGEAGPLMEPQVGPFPVGDYRLTVMLANDLGVGHTTFHCVPVVAAV